jgi:two-component system chemotaxis response regulator CheB
MRTALPVEPASDGLPLRPGVVYVTPPSDQMVIAPERAFRSIERPLARGTSCLAGPLFTSAAAVYGKRVLAVVLTGTGADGADSLLDVKRAGGRIIVQDPATAHSAGMPRAAVATGLADFVLPLDAIGPLLTAFAMTAGAARFLAVRSPSWAQSIPVASRTVAPPA